MRILGWYHSQKRDLPWRFPTPNPYHTWLSEIMLQQTTVVTVIPYFQKFTTLWPTLEDFARASLDDVLVAWQGLGYYSRARNLHKCAQSLINDHGGVFPTSESQLLKLPGIGPYTAAAIASIAFDQPAAAIDGNVIRVMSRHRALSAMRPTLDGDIKKAILERLPESHFGDFTQGLIELGALICKPRSPLCDQCPLASDCLGKKDPHAYPMKKAKAPIPTRHAVAYFVQRNGDQAILLRRREEKGLLGGMIEIPTTPWADQDPGYNTIHAHKPVECDSWVSLSETVKHTFTHFHLEIRIMRGVAEGHSEGLWTQEEDLKYQALPTLMKKIITVGLKGL